MNSLFELNPLYTPQDKKDNPWLKDVTLYFQGTQEQLKENLTLWNYSKNQNDPTIFELLFSFPEPSPRVENFSFASDEFYLAQHPEFKEYLVDKVSQLLDLTTLTEEDTLLCLHAYLKISQTYHQDPNSKIDLVTDFFTLLHGMSYIEDRENLINLCLNYEGSQKVA